QRLLSPRQIGGVTRGVGRGRCAGGQLLLDLGLALLQLQQPRLGLLDTLGQQQRLQLARDALPDQREVALALLGVAEPLFHICHQAETPIEVGIAIEREGDHAIQLIAQLATEAGGLLLAGRNVGEEQTQARDYDVELLHGDGPLTLARAAAAHLPASRGARSYHPRRRGAGAIAGAASPTPEYGVSL